MRVTTAHPPSDDPMMITEAAAKYLNVSKATLERWRAKGIGPRWTKLPPHLVRYRQSDLDAYI